MKSAPPELNQNTWRHLLEIGDGLLSRPAIYDQVNFIKQELGCMTGAEIDLWLLERFKPLPLNTGAFQDGADIPVHFQESFASTILHNVNAQACESLEIPLERDSTILGKIRFSFSESVDLTGAFMDFLSSAGRYIAGILEITRVSVLKDWRHEQLSLVRDVSREISHYRNTAELFVKVVNLVHRTFHFYFVGIFTFTQENRLRLQASAGKNLSEKQVANLNLGDGIPLGKGLVGICAETGKEINAPDVHLDPRYRFVEGLDHARSEICLPLISSEKHSGVLEIISETPNAFHNNDIMVLQILADSISLAIENADLFDDLFDRTWASTVMLQVAEAAQAYEGVDDLLDAIVRILPLLVGVDKCAIFMRGKDAGEFYLNAHYGFEKENEPKLAMLPYNQIVAERFHQVAVLKIPLDLENEVFPAGSPTEKSMTNCCKLIPMVAHGKLFGILMVDQSIETANITTEAAANQQEVAMGIGRQIALAVENFELRESREYEAYVTAVLLQVAEMVAAAEDLDETLANVINLLPLVVGVDTALVYLLDEKSKRVHLRSAYSKSWKTDVDNLPQTIKNGFSRSLELISLNQQAVFCQLGEHSPAQWLHLNYRPFLKNTQVPKSPDPALIIFPLFIGNENFGFLMVYETNEGYEVREKKVEIIKGVAQQLSIAIQNEHLKREMVDQERIRREFQLAQEIQKTFLPEKMPQYAGWEISVRWRPALQVGGDFYDVIQISDSQLGMVIADVSDKGLPAALTMTVARTLIHAAAQSGRTPAETLEQVNRLLLENSREGFFVTVFYSILNVETGELVYTNAGHNQPLLLRKNHREMNWLEKSGMPLGVTNELKLENKMLQIRPGDHLVMYTDGVTEARSPEDILFGEDRLFSTLHTFSARSEESLIEVLDSRILEFQANAPAADDVTIFIIQRTANDLARSLPA